MELQAEDYGVPLYDKYIFRKLSSMKEYQKKFNEYSRKVEETAQSGHNGIKRFFVKTGQSVHNILSEIPRWIKNIFS